MEAMFSEKYPDISNYHNTSTPTPDTSSTFLQQTLALSNLRDPDAKGLF